MLFIDFSSAFNTIIPQQLIHKLDNLGLSTPMCNWLLDFLTGRPQAVRVSSNTSSTIMMNTGAPQGCVLSPLLFTLLTHDCAPSSSSNLFVKFADDTTVVGLINNNDESIYRSEVSRLASWCKDNNLHLNVEKTKEIVVDFRRTHTQHTPLTIDGAAVERVSSTKFLGVHISEDLSWCLNSASLAKKANQRLYFLRKLRRARAPSSIMHTFYSGTIESIMSSCITVWYGACTVSCRKSLQRIVRIAEKIIGVSLPPLLDIYNSRLTRKATRIAGDPTHPSYSLFSLLPSGRRLQSLRARTSRLKNSLFHQAVRRLNSLPALPPIRPLIPFPFPAPASIPPPPPSTLCPQLSTLLHPSAPSAPPPPPPLPATVFPYRTWHHPPPPPPPACSTNSRTLNSAQPSLYCYAICTLPYFLTSSALCLYY
uniref:Reverse transcriptase domain-containing protein n=1 Tax=Gouania willdenowi TaxID=441366 RepID=A0A8C5EG57_GOUWI